jgi:uncharacterized protein YkwD
MKSFFNRVVVLAAILSLSLSGLALSSPTPAQAGLWVPDANECAFLKEINAYRKSRGISPLTFSRSLGAAADNHSNYMAQTDDVDHSLKGGLSWSQNIYNYGYPSGQGIGENVLAGRQSASGAIALWKTSSGHNQNMLNPKWKTIGVGRAVNKDGRYDYYWTTTFGTRSHRTISC